MGALFSGLTSALGGIYGYLAAAGIAAILAGYGSYQVTAWAKDETISSLKLADAKAETDAVQAAKDQMARQDKVTLDSAVAEAEAQARIVTRTVTITRKVPVYVSAQSDSRCVLPNGFVQLLDAAGLQADPDALPGATGEPHDAAAGLSLSEATALLAADLGAAAANAEQLTALQGWIKEQESQAPPARSGARNAHPSP